MGTVLNVVHGSKAYVERKKGAGDRSLFYIVLDKLICISYYEANKH